MSDIPTSTMPDFDNMSPEELQAQWAALQAERESFIAERDMFEAERKEMGTEVRLYIGNLSTSTNESILKEYFEPYGEIKSVHILVDAAGQHKCSGFVTYYYTANAEKAIEQMHDKFKDQDQTHNLIVSFAKQKPKQPPAMHMQAPHAPVPHHGPTPHNPPAVSNTVLYINRVAPDVTEDMLRSVFGRFGTVTQAKVMPDNGYAFVHFSNHDSALMAIAGMNGKKELSVDTLEVSFKTQSKKHAASMGMGAPGGGMGGIRQDRGMGAPGRPGMDGMGSAMGGMNPAMGQMGQMGMPMGMSMPGMGMPPVGMQMGMPMYPNMPMFYDPTYQSMMSGGAPGMAMGAPGMAMGMPGLGMNMSGMAMGMTNMGMGQQQHGNKGRDGGKSGPSAHGTGHRHAPY